MLAASIHLALSILSAVNAEGPRVAQADAARPAAITGRIVDALGCPLIVDLKLRPHTAPFVDGALQEARSDMDGRFTFTNVAPGRYWIHYVLVHNGGWGGDGVVVTASGAHKEIRWSTPRRNPLDFKDRTFIVTDVDGAPIAGAKVSWRRFSGATEGPSCGEDTATNREGRATASESAPGTYRVVIEADGYVPQSRDVKFETGHPDSLTVRLLTAVQLERSSRTIFLMCHRLVAPDTLPKAGAAADAIVVARIARAVLDPDYSVQNERPTVLTRYELQVLEVIKPHARLGANAASAAIVHFAGELDWGKEVLLGCDRDTMRAGETFVLFLDWEERAQRFVPMGGNALLANVTSGEVAPIRPTYTPGPIVTAATGQSAPQYLESVRAAVGNRR